MRIALFNLEPRIENTAMMQVSEWYKRRGDEVEFYSSLFHHEYDRIYAFSIFMFTPKHRVTPDMICGGTGFNITSRLPEEIENSYLDYSIFPKCRTSYLWFSRGCIRNCGFCVVPRKEGSIRSVWPKNLNENGQYVSVMDNNFFANPKWGEAVEILGNIKQPVNFHQGIDIRIFNEEQGEALKKLAIWKQLYIAWDNMEDEDQVFRGLDKLIKYVPKSKIACFVLIGWDTMEEEDKYRVGKLLEYGVDPYAMPFNKRDPYQKAFTRWVNHRLTSKVPWRKYTHGQWKGNNGGR